MKFGVQDFGASPLADRFGIDKYPAVFVDDALIARPEDFYAWGGTAKGKYIPWIDQANRRKFQGDLRKMIDIRLAGGKVTSLEVSRSKPPRNLRLPDVELTTLSGETFRLSKLAGKPVLVEFWATWCPPCIQTLSWMKALDGHAAIVGVTVESERGDVEKLVQKIQPAGRIVIGSPALTEAFGGIPAVPTLFLADGKGRIVKVFYGSPPTLHADIQRELAKLK